MTVLAAIYRELNDADATGDKHVVHIRVTVDALAGSVVSVPVTPERARALGPLREEILWSAYGSVTGVGADPYETEKMLEILIHPADYLTLRREEQFGVEIEGGDIEHVCGIPVTR